MAERFARIPQRAVGCRELSARVWRVLACIALHADKDGRAWPSLTTIAAITDIDRSKIPALIKRLIAAGLLRATRRRDHAGDAASTLYDIIFESTEVFPKTATPVSDPGNTVLPETGTRGVGTNGNVTDQGTDQRTRTRARRAARERVLPPHQGASEFEAFWRVYPGRGPHPNPKKPARLAFEAAVKRGIYPAAIIRGAENYAAYAARHVADPKFVSRAVTWLGQELWDQYQQPPEPPWLRVGMN